MTADGRCRRSPDWVKFDVPKFDEDAAWATGDGSTRFGNNINVLVEPKPIITDLPDYVKLDGQNIESLLDAKIVSTDVYRRDGRDYGRVEYTLHDAGDPGPRPAVHRRGRRWRLGDRHVQRDQGDVRRRGARDRAVPRDLVEQLSQPAATTAAPTDWALWQSLERSRDTGRRTDPRLQTEYAMPIATPDVYAAMLDKAKAEQFAYPAINVSSSQTLHAALRGFAEAGSDGIVQVSTGGAEFFSGTTIKDMVAGSRAFAAFAHEAAEGVPDQHRAAHRPLPEGQARRLRPAAARRSRKERVDSGELPLFQSHMWDGSAVPLEENLSIARELLEQAAAAKIVLEIEVGVVGGEEDGVVGAIDDKLYSTAEDALRTVEALGTGENGRYMTALTFGNVHGVYKPGNVKLRPSVLKTAQDAVVEKLGLDAGSKPFDLVFHGGSGSLLEEIREALDYGVIKMNVDTDTQYAFTRPVVDHMFANYDGVLKVDGEVGNKKAYDPRAWGKAAETGMAARVVTACEDLRSAGTSLSA